MSNVKIEWTITHKYGRVPRDQWNQLGECIERMLPKVSGSRFVYSHQRTSGPTWNGSSVHLGLHPKSGGSAKSDMVLKRSGSGSVTVPKEYAAPFFAVLQCCHELFKDPTKLDWQVSEVPETSWIELARHMLDHAEHVPVKDDTQRPDTEWDTDDVTVSETDDGPTSDRDSSGPQKDGPASDAERTLEKLREMLTPEQSAEIDMDALREQLQSMVDDIKEDAKKQIEQIVPQPAEIKITSEADPEPVEIEGLHHHKLPEILEWLQAGINVMLVGPAGSGKTTLAAQCAELLGRDFSFTGALMQKYELLGYQDANGTYHRTPFRNAFEHGHVYLWDEIDASNPQAAVAFNAALENPWADFPDAVIPRHENFVSIAAANTFGHGANRQYVGRNALDGATLDRFAVIELDYDSALEHALSNNQEWVAKVQAWRTACHDLGLKHIISQRASIKGAQMLRRGVLSEADIANALVFKGLDKDSCLKVMEKAGIGV